MIQFDSSAWRLIGITCLEQQAFIQTPPSSRSSRNASNPTSAYALTRVAVSGPLRSNNVQMLRQAARGSAGIALLPEWLIEGDVLNGQLVRLFPHALANLNNSGNSINLIYLPSQRHSTLQRKRSLGTQCRHCSKNTAIP
ncbi:LysR substrate-binding domain-containing protein [Pseudomonas sp. GM30]|uniref:LysR substrate-binding domain-containing protein n=1 Tax=Pseudomonas sp. GM30 TaxID=1144328 RepID=UPI0009DE44E0